MSREDVLAQATAVAEAAARLAEAAVDDVPDDRLAPVAAELARAKALIEASLVAVADRLTQVDTARATGWASAKDLLTHLTGGHKGAGGGIVRLAEQTRDLPAVRDALAAGVLSIAQARVVTARVNALPRDPEFRARVADALVERVATHRLDATDLDRCVPEVVRELDPDGRVVGSDLERPRRERGAHGARFLAFSPDGLGGMRIRGYASLEEGETVKAVLLPLAAPVTTEPGACGGDPGSVSARDAEGRQIPGCPDPVCNHDGRDRRDAGARLWDALVDACARLRATDVLPHDHGSTARITVTTTYDDLRDRAVDAGLLGSGERISGDALRRLACDAEILPAVLGSDGRVLDVGRASRLVTSAIWQALVLRDRHCAFPGCDRPPFACDAHHVVHWSDGGPTSLDNLVLLCRRHHTLTHVSPWELRIDPASGRPHWRPPPAVDDRDRFTYLPATHAPPAA